MREIKFRFFSPDTGMIDDHYGWREGIGINEALQASSGYGYKIMQYTGLKDKNGKEIYEGDIVKSNDNFAFEIFYKNSAFYAITKDAQQIFSSYAISKMEIIGNIYETPELL